MSVEHRIVWGTQQSPKNSSCRCRQGNGCAEKWHIPWFLEVPGMASVCLHFREISIVFLS